MACFSFHCRGGSTKSRRGGGYSDSVPLPSMGALHPSKVLSPDFEKLGFRPLYSKGPHHFFFTKKLKKSPKGEAIAPITPLDSALFHWVQYGLQQFRLPTGSDTVCCSSHWIRLGGYRVLTAPQLIRIPTEPGLSMRCGAGNWYDYGPVQYRPSTRHSLWRDVTQRNPACSSPGAAPRPDPSPAPAAPRHDLT